MTKTYVANIGLIFDNIVDLNNNFINRYFLRLEFRIIIKVFFLENNIY